MLCGVCPACRELHPVLRSSDDGVTLVVATHHSDRPDEFCGGSYLTPRTYVYQPDMPTVAQRPAA